MINNEISQYPSWSQVFRDERKKKVKILAKLHQGQNKHTESALSDYGSLSMRERCERKSLVLILEV